MPTIRAASLQNAGGGQDAASAYTLRAASDGTPDAMMPPADTAMGKVMNALGPAAGPTAMAGVLGAGAAMDSALDQIQRAVRFVQHARSIGTLDEPKYKALMDELDANILSKAQTYKPVKDAFPYATAAGEAAPAVVAGRGGFSAAMFGNLGRTYFNEVLQLFQKENPDAIPNWLKNVTATLGKL